jgi:PAS domain S-box-containing protein
MDLELTATSRTPLLTALEELAPPDHLCVIYETPEEYFAVAVPFIRIGLDRGEKCVYIADDGNESAVRDAMRAGGIDVERAVAAGRLVMEKRNAAYLKDGSFDPERMLAYWENATADALRGGFSALRATGETDWVVAGAEGIERWIEYESRFAHILARHRCLALCQYNRWLFPPEIILNVVRTHPTVILRGAVCRNMYYVPPDELLGTNQAAREVERLLATIREREEIDHALRRQHDELQRSEERWRSVFENSAIGIVLADASGKILEANRAFRQLLGYTSEELASLTYADITHAADITRGADFVGQLVSGAQREVQLEKRYRHKNGEYIWVRATGTLLRGGDGTPVYLLGLIEDATKRKSAEQELAASVSQLHALAGRLMHEQDDERRRIAKMLHETTAQDMAALKMHLARLSRTASHLSEADRALLIESISLVEQSINEIRTLSYLLHPPFLDEIGLLSALRWYVAGFAERSGVAVSLELPESFDRLPRDTETALFRIVQEALINIHRHADSKTARIGLRHDAGTLVLEIEDWGRGIPATSLKQITTRGGVVGVGIAGMSERVEQLGGRLELTSTDRGSTGTIVRVCLPQVQEVS